MLKEVIGIDAKTFDRDIRGQRFYKGRASQEMIAGLFGWNEINVLLDNSAKYLNRISLVREDNRLDRRVFVDDLSSFGKDRLVAPAVRKALSEGYSLLMDEVQEYFPAARLLAEALIAEVGEQIGINAYISWTGDRCFRTHWDEHDVFIIQTEGEKEWTVFQPTRPYPIAHDVEFERMRDDLEVAWEGVLRPGDVLYIPRGWWHHAKSTGAGSIHLTIGFTGRTWLDLMTFLRDRACEEAAFREELTRPSQDGDYLQAQQRFKAKLLEFVTQQLDDQLLERFWRRHYAVLPTRSRSALPHVIEYETFRDTDFEVQIASLAPSIIIERADESIALAMGGKRWEFALDAYPVLDALADGSRKRVSELAAAAGGTLSAEQTWALVFELANEGVVWLERPAPIAVAPELESIA
jgi:hypothetical protein